jgi:predicted Rossmann-fold nucleotide-binding protein
MAKRLKTIAIIAGGDPVPEKSDRAGRALKAGRIVAELDCDLLTGGGGGAMVLARRGFCDAPDRAGRSIGIIPGRVVGLVANNLGHFPKLTLTPKAGYPGDAVEVAIFTHLPGDDPKGEKSRNLLIVASADVVVALAGNKGAQAELELALGLGKPVIAFIAASESIGAYRLPELPPSVTHVQDGEALRKALESQLGSLG